MSLEFRIGDVFDRLAEIPDGTIDLIVTSPPFLALRSYLPADHPNLAAVREAGIAIHVHGWRKRSGRWELHRDEDVS